VEMQEHHRSLLLKIDFSMAVSEIFDH